MEANHYSVRAEKVTLAINESSILAHKGKRTRTRKKGFLFRGLTGTDSRRYLDNPAPP